MKYYIVNPKLTQPAATSIHGVSLGQMQQRAWQRSREIIKERAYAELERKPKVKAQAKDEAMKLRGSKKKPVDPVPAAEMETDEVSVVT